MKNQQSKSRPKTTQPYIKSSKGNQKLKTKALVAKQSSMDKFINSETINAIQNENKAPNTGTQQTFIGILGKRPQVNKSSALQPKKNLPLALNNQGTLNSFGTLKNTTIMSPTNQQLNLKQPQLVSVVDISNENKNGEFNGHFNSIVDIPIPRINQNVTNITQDAENLDRNPQFEGLYHRQETGSFMMSRVESPKASISAQKNGNPTTPKKKRIGLEQTSPSPPKGSGVKFVGLDQKALNRQSWLQTDDQFNDNQQNITRNQKHRSEYRDKSCMQDAINHNHFMPHSPHSSIFQNTSNRLTSTEVKHKQFMEIAKNQENPVTVVSPLPKKLNQATRFNINIEQDNKDGCFMYSPMQKIKSSNSAFKEKKKTPIDLAIEHYAKNQYLQPQERIEEPRGNNIQSNLPFMPQQQTQPPSIILKDEEILQSLKSQEHKSNQQKMKEANKGIAKDNHDIMTLQDGFGSSLNNSYKQPYQRVLRNTNQKVKPADAGFNLTGSQSSKLAAGLKELSMKVFQRVKKSDKEQQEKGTTYKQVATDLIKELKSDGATINFTQENPSDELNIEDSESLGDEQGPSENNTACKKNSILEDKGEKNIRRRVYDALNVQVAAGVLEKKGKFIKPNYGDPTFQLIQQSIDSGCHLTQIQCNEELSQSQMVHLSIQSKKKRIQKNKLKLEEMKKELQNKKQKIEDSNESLSLKKQDLSDKLKQQICYQKVIQKNKVKEDDEIQSVDQDEKYKLPFVLFTTKDNGQGISCHYENDNRLKLIIGTQCEFGLGGDIDLFMKSNSSQSSQIVFQESQTNMCQVKSIDYLKKIIAFNQCQKSKGCNIEQEQCRCKDALQIEQSSQRTMAILNKAFNHITEEQKDLIIQQT